MKILVLSPADKGARNVVRDFVYGCWCRGRRIGGMQMPPLNLLYLATVLKDGGHDVDLIDAGLDYSAYESAITRAKEYCAVILLTSTNSFRLDVKSCRELKDANPGISTIVFGAHPTFMPHYCLKEDCIDFIVRREPEFIVRDLVGCIVARADWSRVRGIGYRGTDGSIVLNDYYPFIDNMDDLPIPDRSLLPASIDYFNPVVERMPYTTMQTSRGCPARCSFCTVPSFFGNRVRARSASLVVEEMRRLRHMGYREIFIRDETFTVYKSRNAEICENLLHQKLDLTWIANARVDLIDEETLALMKRAGCHLVKFGVESGDQEILDNIRKGIRLEQTRAAFAACHKIGLDTHAHVMLGCPGETSETIERTISFVKSLSPSTASFGILTPYPGTAVFRELAKDHPEIEDGSDACMERLHVSAFFNQYFTQLSPDELEAYVRTAYRKFYFRPSYLVKRLLSMNDLSQLMRWSIAATNIFSFGLRGEN
jgi:anaerobic magnesium-protoporphyrin IX monomethyl ester cyclase